MSGRTVWLASYPKSGNTWLRAVYTALRTGADPNINALEGGNSPSSRWLFDSVLGVRSSDLLPEEIDRLRPHADVELVARAGGDVWRKIHDALLPGPSGELVVSAEATRAALYILRDPRDVAVSLARYDDLPLERAVELLCRDDAALAAGRRELSSLLLQRLGSWSEHVHSWVDTPAFPVHVLRYEDCLADPVASFQPAFAAAGLEVSASELAGAVASSSWERLRAQEDSVGFVERLSATSPFFRRGRAGGWAEELAPNLARRIVDAHGAVMARFGYLES